MLYLFPALGGFYTNTVSTCGVGEFALVKYVLELSHLWEIGVIGWMMKITHGFSFYCTQISIFVPVYINKVYIVLNNYNFGQAMKTCLDELMPVTVNGGSTFKKSLTD